MLRKSIAPLDVVTGTVNVLLHCMACARLHGIPFAVKNHKNLYMLLIIAKHVVVSAVLNGAGDFPGYCNADVAACVKCI